MKSLLLHLAVQLLTVTVIMSAFKYYLHVIGEQEFFSTHSYLFHPFKHGLKCACECHGSK